MLLLCALQLVDEMGDGVEADALVLPTGGDAQADGQVALAQPRIADHEHRLGLFQVMTLG